MPTPPRRGICARKTLRSRDTRRRLEIRGRDDLERARALGLRLEDVAGVEGVRGVAGVHVGRTTMGERHREPAAHAEVRARVAPHEPRLHERDVRCDGRMDRVIGDVARDEDRGVAELARRVEAADQAVELAVDRGEAVVEGDRPGARGPEPDRIADDAYHQKTVHRHQCDVHRPVP